MTNEETIHDLFYVCETSKSGLRYKSPRLSGYGRVMKKVGDEAGFLSNNRYWVVCVNGKVELVHRLILELSGIDTHGKCVDHIDGNGKNNSLSNIRAVSMQENQRNRRKNSNNASGINGVCRYKRVDKGKDYWYCLAQWIDENGDHKSKTFGEVKFGQHAAMQKAIQHRENALRDVNNALLLRGEGLYTERHGT